MAQLGWIESHEGRGVEAEALERAALARERRTLRRDNALTLETLHKLSIMVGDQGRAEEAAALRGEWSDAVRRKQLAEAK